MNNAIISFLVAHPVVADGFFQTIRRGGTNLRQQWDTVAMFVGAIAVIGAVIFAGVAIFKSRDKGSWWLRAAIAVVFGAILLIAGSVNMIQGDFGDTWGEVFNTINFVGPFLGL